MALVGGEMRARSEEQVGSRFVDQKQHYGRDEYSDNAEARAATAAVVVVMVDSSLGRSFAPHGASICPSGLQNKSASTNEGGL